jgi:hypothetical protein
MLRRLPFLTALLVTALLVTAPLATAPVAAQQIDTGTPPLGTEGGEVLRYTPFFAGNVAQTFVTPGGIGTLTQFRFWARNDASDFQVLHFRAHIYGWDDATQTPSLDPLWSSAEVTGTASATPQPFTFATPGLVILPGQTYAAVLSPLGSAFPPPGMTFQGLVLAALGNAPGAPIDTYPEGSGYLLQTARGPLLSPLVTRWTATTDFAFTATFAQPTAVPEPGTTLLLAAGLTVLGVGAARRARR